MAWSDPRQTPAASLHHGPAAPASPPHWQGIALSGFGRDEDLASSQQAGFDVHLVKPVSLDLLEQTLRRLALKDGNHTSSQ